jgi:acetyl esterase
MSMETTIGLAAGIEPATRVFLELVNRMHGTPIYRMTPDNARKALLKLQSGGIPRMPADIRDLSLPGGPRGAIRVRMVRPVGTTGEVLPAVMYFHGGGWVLGDRDTHDRLVREIANRSRSAVFFVDYDRSPEARYPVAIEEAYMATRYVSANGADLNVDGSRLAVVGDSVGGNMATIVSMMALRRRGPEIGLQVLFYPVTDARFDTPSYQQFAEGYWLSREAMKWFWDQYMPDKRLREQLDVSPLQASTDRLEGLPPALVVTGEFDVLRDEGERYAQKLTDAGVDVTAVRFLGTIHDFLMLDALAGTPAARGAVDLACRMLQDVMA